MPRKIAVVSGCAAGPVTSGTPLLAQQGLPPVPPAVRARTSGFSWGAVYKPGIWEAAAGPAETPARVAHLQAEVPLIGGQGRPRRFQGPIASGRPARRADPAGSAVGHRNRPLRSRDSNRRRYPAERAQPRSPATPNAAAASTWLPDAPIEAEADPRGGPRCRRAAALYGSVSRRSAS